MLKLCLIIVQRIVFDSCLQYHLWRVIITATPLFSLYKWDILRGRGLSQVAYDSQNNGNDHRNASNKQTALSELKYNNKILVFSS